MTSGRLIRLGPDGEPSDPPLVIELELDLTPAGAAMFGVPCWAYWPDTIDWNLLVTPRLTSLERILRDIPRRLGTAWRVARTGA